MNEYDELQRQALLDAKNLASEGQEFSHLCKILNAESQARLRIFIQKLPNDVARKTIYGRAVTHEEESKPKKAARPRVKGDKGR